MWLLRTRSRSLARSAAMVQQRMIAAVSSWPPENTSATSLIRTRSVRRVVSGLNISILTPRGSAARTPAFAGLAVRVRAARSAGRA